MTMLLRETLLNSKRFFQDRRNLLVLGALPALGAWIFSRVWMVNPAILGDEYLYSMNSRKVGPWDPPAAGDFSNYLFNLVYQSTNLCGEGFYTCGKLLNIAFFLGFVFTIFVVARRFISFWGAFAFMIAAGLSPLNVYTSMFLPESMYFFFIGLVLLAVLRAMTDFTWLNWMVVGIAIGIASLVKPHAWLSAIAVGVTFLVVGLTSKKTGLKAVAISGVGLAGGAVLARILIGVAVAGPKALGFFGGYLGASTVETLVEGATGNTSQMDAAGATIQNPIDGVLQLFPNQLNIHLLTISSLMAIGIVGVTVGVWTLAKEKNLTPVSAFSLFAFIWLVSLVIEIVIFTGWVTGTGDDHSTRVLIRYYDFLFVIVPLAGLSTFASATAKAGAFVRWMLAVGFVALLTPAFTGFFGSLTIQIADAPTLAGLIVNLEVFNAAALLSVGSLLVFATFPRFASWTFAALLPVTMVATGWQIQDQYQGFRGTLNASDTVGQWLASELSDEALANTWVVGTSRFEATNVAIWADSLELSYEIFGPGSVIGVELAPSDTQYIVTTGAIEVSGYSTIELSGEGYSVYRID